MLDMAAGIANCMSNHQKSVENEDDQKVQVLWERVRGKERDAEVLL